MLYNVVMYIVYVVEMLISYIFFSRLGERKVKPSYCWLIGILLFSTGFLVNHIFANTVWLNITYFAIINIVFGFLCFHVKLKKTIFCSLVLGACCLALELATIFLISSLFNIETTSHLNQISILILEGIISKVLYFITCVILTNLIKSDKNNIKFPLSFYLYPIVVLCSLLVSWYICAHSQISNITQTLLSIVSAALFVSVVVLFVSYQHNIEKENELFQLKNEMDKIETEKIYYDILEQQNQDLMIYAHDAKKHLTAIKNLNDNPQIEEYINIMAENLETYSQVSQSGNQTLDVILSKYMTECKIKNIKISFDTRLKNFDYVTDYDLVTILGNLLDNALESAEKSEKREISLSTDCRNTYDVLIITNSCDLAPKSSNNHLITTKTDKKIHGVGIKSVIKTLKKYNGDYDWRYDSLNKTFTSIVMISNTK